MLLTFHCYKDYFPPKTAGPRSSGSSMSFLKGVEMALGKSAHSAESIGTRSGRLVLELKCKGYCKKLKTRQCPTIQLGQTNQCLKVCQSLLRRKLRAPSKLKAIKTGNRTAGPARYCDGHDHQDSLELGLLVVAHTTDGKENIIISHYSDGTCLGHAHLDQRNSISRQLFSAGNPFVLPVLLGMECWCNSHHCCDDSSGNPSPSYPSTYFGPCHLLLTLDLVRNAFRISIDDKFA